MDRGHLTGYLMNPTCLEISATCSSLRCSGGGMRRRFPLWRHWHAMCGPGTGKGNRAPARRQDRWAAKGAPSPFGEGARGLWMCQPTRITRVAVNTPSSPMLP